MLSFPLIWSKSVLWRKMAFLPGNVFLALHRIIINVIPQRFHTTLNKYWPNKLEGWAKSLLSDLQFTMKISWTSLYWNGIIATLQLYKERKQTKTSVLPRKTLGSQKKKNILVNWIRISRRCELRSVAISFSCRCTLNQFSSLCL